MKVIGIGALCAALACAASADDSAVHPYESFLPARYAVIGQYPDGGRTYSGRAQITFAQGRFELTRRIDGQTLTAVGAVERAVIAEADVVRFRWPGYESTCLVGTDLDNYGRLTCYWYADDAEHAQPGLEAYFPTEAWP